MKAFEIKQEQLAARNRWMSFAFVEMAKISSSRVIREIKWKRVAIATRAWIFYLNKKPIWIPIIHFNCIFHSFNHKRSYFVLHTHTRAPEFTHNLFPSIHHFNRWHIYSSFLFALVVFFLLLRSQWDRVCTDF